MMLNTWKVLVSIGKRAIFFLLIVALVSCDSSTPTPAPSALFVQLEAGSAWVNAYPNNVELELQQSTGLGWNQKIQAGEEEIARLLVGKDDQLWLDPGSVFKLIQPTKADNRPVLRLDQGGLRYRAVGNEHALAVHIEVPFELLMLIADLFVAPVAAETELEIVIEDDVVTLVVSSGEVMAEGNGVSATLLAEWRAIVRPDEPMEVISPTLPDTPTPTVTPTPTRTPKPSATPTPAFTLTSTPALTPTPTLTPTVTPTLTPTATFVWPTFTPTSPPPTAPPPTSPPPTSPPKPPTPTPEPPTPTPEPPTPTPEPPTPTPEPPTPEPPTPEPTVGRPTLGPSPTAEP